MAKGFISEVAMFGLEITVWVENGLTQVENATVLE